MSINVKTQDFELSVLEESHKRPVFVDFWATWCAPCRALTPVLEKLEAQFENRFLLAKVNTEEEQQLAVQFSISSIPNVKIFYAGKMVDEFVGALPEESLKEIIQNNLPDPKLEEALSLFKKKKYTEAAEIVQEAKLKGDLAAKVLWEGAMQALSESKKDDMVGFLTAIEKFNTAYSDSRQELLYYLEHADAADIEILGRLKKEDTATEAMQTLFEKFETSSGAEKEINKKKFLAAFSIIGNTSSLALEYRKKLSRAMF